MKRTLAFGRLFLLQPALAAKECLRESALFDSLKIYAVWVAASLFFLWLKPYDFPDVNAAMPSRVQGVSFWLMVAFWEPVLAALNIALTGLILRWMRDGWLPLKTAAATLWCTLPLILTVAYTRSAMPKLLYALLFLAWTVPGILYARRMDLLEWRRTATFLLGLNVVGLLFLVPQAAALALRSSALYFVSMIATAVWLLACGGTGLRDLAKTSLPRAVLALLFANLALTLVLFVSYMLGWIPKEVFKVVVYV